MRHKEDDEQRAYFDWVSIERVAIYGDPTNTLAIRDYIAAMPNGGNRDRTTGAILKATGVRPGYPDIIIDIPVAPYSGARIEMKKQRKDYPRHSAAVAAVSPAQRQYISRLARVGYYCAVCYGWEEAREVTLNYLDGNVSCRGSIDE